MPTFNPVTPELITQLTAILGAGSISTARADIDLHAKDQSQHHAVPPEVVVWPHRRPTGRGYYSKLANELHVPVTPWGVGTGLEGNSIPVHGGILMSFETYDQNC